MKEFFVNADEMKAIDVVPEDATGKFAVISSADDLVEQFKKGQLQTLIASVRGKELKGDESKSAKKLAFEIYKMVTEPKPAATPKEKKPPKVTKVSMAREILTAKGSILKKDLAEAIGHDLQNCHTMISILKNPTRTKSPLYVAYDKSATMYTLCADKKAMLKMEEGFVATATAAKEKKEADAKAAKDAAAKEKADAKAAKEKADAKAAKEAEDNKEE